MYVVTFYSFKGGVGRTLAMMNCAAALVEEGKKVLVVDFDLEAPGLDTFELRLGKRKKFGIVDYVNEYINSGIAPEIDKYLLRGYFDKKKTETLGELWVMPAGNRSSDYHTRFNSIDWRHLYDQQYGYLLFENLKAQWRNHLNPDYVLIDSRTGYTDVGSICTRQLPDALVLLFFPNEQNLSGLVPLVERVREEPKDRILHFVMSNVPDIDDEHSILGKRLQNFRENLKYTKLTSAIHHYPSLSLLDQEIFVVTRPKSRLASEYRRLVWNIQKENPQDHKGAMMYLDGIESGRKIASNLANKREIHDEIEKKFTQILAHHHEDIEIVERIVEFKEINGELEEAAKILDQFLESALFTPESWVKIALIADRLGQKDTAKDYAISASNHCDLSIYELNQTIRLLKLYSPETLESIHSWRSVDKLEWRDLQRLSQFLSYEQSSLKYSEILIRIVLEKIEKSDERSILMDLLINLIGQRKFRDAINLAINFNQKYAFEQVIAFNLAMAKWGESQRVSLEDFRIVVKEGVDESREDANYSQCISLVYCVLGDKKLAVEWLEKAKNENKSFRIRNFSCWTYLYLNPKKFQQDLEEQEKMINGENLLPRIICPDSVLEKSASLKNITEASLKDALREFDELGRSAMLDKYGGRPSTRWYIEFDGINYDQKLILRAAHCIQTGQKFSKFTAAQAKNRLERLGFTVVSN